MTTSIRNNDEILVIAGKWNQINKINHEEWFVPCDAMMTQYNSSTSLSYINCLLSCSKIHVMAYNLFLSIASCLASFFLINILSLVFANEIIIIILILSSSFIYLPCVASHKIVSTCYWVGQRSARRGMTIIVWRDDDLLLMMMMMLLIPRFHFYTNQSLFPL